MTVKIAHIIQDEKFIDNAYLRFQEASLNESVYFLPGKKKPTSINLVSPVRISFFSFLNSKFIAELKAYDAVIFHSLTIFNCEIAIRLKGCVKMYWIGMGFDYYDLINSSRFDLYLNRTRSYFITLSDENKIPKIIKSFKHFFYRCYSYRKLKAIASIDFFSPVLRSEYDLLQDKYPGVIGEFLPWNYNLISNLISSDSVVSLSSHNNLLIGNSASPNNNHLDVFYTIINNKSLIKDVDNIIVPLSYGDMKYRDFVIEHGYRLFGPKFKPITNMMSYSDYIEVIGSCKIALMGHLRQQALGNILALLFMGAKLYIYRCNILYEDLEDLGFIFGDMEELNNLDDTFRQQLSNEEKLINKKNVSKYHSKTVSIKNTVNLIKSITSNT